MSHKSGSLSYRGINGSKQGCVCMPEVIRLEFFYTEFFVFFANGRVIFARLIVVVDIHIQQI